MACLWQAPLCHAGFYLLQVCQGAAAHSCTWLATVSSCLHQKLQCNIYLYWTNVWAEKMKRYSLRSGQTEKESWGSLTRALPTHFSEAVMEFEIVSLPEGCHLWLLTKTQYATNNKWGSRTHGQDKPPPSAPFPATTWCSISKAQLHKLLTPQLPPLLKSRLLHWMAISFPIIHDIRARHHTRHTPSRARCSHPRLDRARGARPGEALPGKGTGPKPPAPLPTASTA